MTTLVTSYYKIKSKFSHETYLSWIKNFIQLKAKIIIYTSNDLLVLFNSIINDNTNIKIITIPFEDLYMQKYKIHWIKHHDVDPEKKIHTPDLYMIWSQKIIFLQNASEENYYNTEYFFWCDIGAFRGSVDKRMIELFPTNKYFQKHKILFSSINRLKNDDINKIYCIRENKLVGGLFGGDKTAILNWRIEYEKTLNYYFDNNMFAGKDQTVMLSTYIRNPNLAIIVASNVSDAIEEANNKNDIIPPDKNWFYLEYLLSEMAEFEIDKTYVFCKYCKKKKDKMILDVCKRCHEHKSN